MTGLRKPRRSPDRVPTPLTLVDAVTREPVHVVVELDSVTPVAALEAAAGGELWLDGERLNEAGDVRAGAVLGLGGPLGCPGPAVRVVAGVDAGAVHPLARQMRLGGALLEAGQAGVVVTRPGCSPSVLRPGTVLDVGDRVLSLDSGPRVARDPEVTRPPRLRPSRPVVTLSPPAEPAPVEGRRLPVVPLLLPLLLGVAMALLANPLFLLFTLLSPLMALSTWWSDRGQARRTNRTRAEDHERETVAFAAAEEELRAREIADLRTAWPDALREVVAGPRLWERRRSDDDCLVLRVGTGCLPPSSYRLTTGAPAPLPGVPVTVSLRDVGVLGVTGGRAMARWLVVQACALHSPRDLSVWLLIDPARGPAEEDWGWLRWLPHARSVAVLVGNSVETLALRIAELTALVAARTARDVRTQLVARQEPHVLVVLDGARGLRSLAGVAALLRDGPAVGVHVVCVDDSDLLLPEECQAVLTPDELRRQGREPVGVQPDLASAAWAEELARSLAPLRDAGPATETEVPTSARLLDVLGLDAPTAERVRARAGRTTAAVIGVGAGGPVTLDLVRDGPHVLVAGTTGAGKSELLQSLIASLAVANNPEAMTFVLVDYKGGAAFKDCARLPHTVGMVTDLDGHLAERALASLTAELKSRERLLQDAAAKDIEALWRTGAALPRLVVVVDEFASLVEELPDFVRGLVGIAQRGRSLGLHLVLATQRPSGVVSPEIRANTNLRVALRVTDAAESLDVVDAPDAAAISRSTPGRALARTGPGPLLAFQTARVGGRPPGTASDLRVVPWREVGLSPPLPVGADDDSDLHALVAAVRAAHPHAAPRSPWLPPLPALVPFRTGEPGSAVLGREDRPEEQRQQDAVWDLAGGGHLLVAGAARSGRTTALLALTTSLVATTSPDDVHVYALDCGNGGLACLTSLPHTGAVVTRNEPDRADRLLARLTAEVARRQETGETRPHLLLLLDRWEGFTAAFGDIDAGRLPEALLRLLREGAAVGLRAVLSGDRTALLGKLPHTVEDMLVLRLADRSDYALAGLSPRRLPDVIGDGRGFRGGHEVQVAHVTAQHVLDLRVSPATTRPFRVDPLPSQITWEEALTLPGNGFAVGGDELCRVGADLTVGFTVAGPPRSGRSTALVAIARSLTGATVCTVTPRPSPLRGLGTDTPDAAALVAVLNAGPAVVVVDDAELVPGDLADLLAQVLRDGRDTGHSVVVGGTTEDLAAPFRGFLADARRSRSGLLLGLTNHLDGELLGLRLPRSAVGPAPVGRGLLVRGGSFAAVQVPVSSAR